MTLVKTITICFNKETVLPQNVKSFPHHSALKITIQGPHLVKHTPYMYTASDMVGKQYTQLLKLNLLTVITFRILLRAKLGQSPLIKY